jgi:hypothetical protein
MIFDVMKILERFENDERNEIENDVVLWNDKRVNIFYVKILISNEEGIS